MYKRDVAIVLLSVIALFLSLQDEGSFEFRKAWYHELDEAGASGAAVRLDRDYGELPAPLVVSFMCVGVC
jgi:hypothetical protein